MELRSRIRLSLVAGVTALAARAGTVAAAGTTATPHRLDQARLRTAMDAVHRAGVPGVFGEVRDAGRTWRGASGVADLATGRPPCCLAA
ncbi:hypothetical protein ACFV0D_36040 [Streptomyces sp. NPDC059556]|uniref:hypothetical protein n=1 Tax=Streptomyces sp. NPDC059556 TaxID=3346863 RepID=UPI0036B29322